MSTDFHIYQYFIQVVPTEVRTYTSNVDTYQFAVTERVIIDSLPYSVDAVQQPVLVHTEGAAVQVKLPVLIRLQGLFTKSE